MAEATTFRGNFVQANLTSLIPLILPMLAPPYWHKTADNLNIGTTSNQSFNCCFTTWHKLSYPHSKRGPGYY